jgi:hypothetical protein
MKTKTVKRMIVLFTVLTLLFSCTKNTGHIINSYIKQEFEINSGDTLKVNLGTFGDEEGATIFKNPIYAKISKLNRQINSSSILYMYLPQDNFVGKDSVLLILNRGSDGASSGKNDTTIIRITVNK